MSNISDGVRQGLVALALIISTPAFAQLSETMQRAAYCIGVLEVTLKNSDAQDAPDNVCLGWKEQNHASREACIHYLKQSTRASFEQKLKRYRDYLYREMMQRTLLQNADVANLIMSRSLVERKGRDDAEAVRKHSPSGYPDCVSQCRGKEDRCVIDCVGRENPTAAAVLRCGMLHDELPY